ncbi:hypothetical protein M758_8G049300 [Ceratodon purpureus]|nr:hypothetical protein M758_8G049300 [Ceratodon purpureus]
MRLHEVLGKQHGIWRSCGIQWSTLLAFLGSHKGFPKVLSRPRIFCYHFWQQHESLAMARVLRALVLCVCRSLLDNIAEVPWKLWFAILMPRCNSTYLPLRCVENYSHARSRGAGI